MCTSSNLIKISSDILEQKLRTQSTLCLLLDCRPFLAHNESHILNAINIHYPPILKRRNGGRLPLRTIIPDVITRERLISGQFCWVVLYEEQNNKLNQNLNDNLINNESIVNSVAQCLQQEASLKSIYILDGGFQKFRQTYPQMCISKESLRNNHLNESPILGNLTWPLKSNTTNGIQNKICCSSLATSPRFLSGSSKYQLLFNNNNYTNNNNSNNIYINNNKNNICANSYNLSNVKNKNNLIDDNSENINNNIDSAKNSKNYNHDLNNFSKCKTNFLVNEEQCAGYNNYHNSQFLNNCNLNNNNFTNFYHNHHLKYQQPFHQSLNQLNCNYNNIQQPHVNHNFHIHNEQCANQQQQFNNCGLGRSCSNIKQANGNNSYQVCSNLLNQSSNVSMSLSNLNNVSSNNYCNNNNNYNNNNNNNNNNLSANWNSKFNSFGNDEIEPVEILPHLLLGSELHASQLNILKRIGVTALLNVSHSCPNHFEQDFLYKCIPVQDSNFEDISVYFSEAIQFIEEIKKQNGRVLVHCHAGISRSATICMAYIMATKHLRMEDAYEFVKNRRRIVSPNFNFMGQLLNFEFLIFGKKENTKKLDDHQPIPVSIETMYNEEKLNEETNSIDLMVDKNSISPNKIITHNSSNLTINSNCHKSNIDNKIIYNNANLFVNSTSNEIAFSNTKDKKLNIFDFSTNSTGAATASSSIGKLGISPIKQLNKTNLNTPLLSPT